MNLSLPRHNGSWGLNLIFEKYIATAISTADNEPPVCPEPAVVSIFRILIRISLAMFRAAGYL